MHLLQVGAQVEGEGGEQGEGDEGSEEGEGSEEDEGGETSDSDGDWDPNNWPHVNPPQVPTAYEPPRPPPGAPQLRGRGLQVIVKVAQIVLTPERPAYPGGSWHLEGMVNEHIAASLIAYTDSDNVEASELAFRGAVNESELDYEQNDGVGVQSVYGLRDGDPLTQPLGAVHTAPGRVVCFPNKFQHRVQPFKLADASRRGVREIVALFVVDPATRVPSTAAIPPQQMAWWRPLAKLGAKLPPEAVAEVEKRVEFPMAYDAALRHREALMAERSAGAKKVDGEVYELEFSLCEH